MQFNGNEFYCDTAIWNQALNKIEVKGKGEIITKKEGESSMVFHGEAWEFELDSSGIGSYTIRNVYYNSAARNDTVTYSFP